MIDTIQIMVFTVDKSAPTVTKSAEAGFADVAANSFAKSTDVTLMGILQDGHFTGQFRKIMPCNIHQNF